MGIPSVGVGETAPEERRWERSWIGGDPEKGKVRRSVKGGCSGPRNQRGVGCWALAETQGRQSPGVGGGVGWGCQRAGWG